jgi:membrane dipeptidase
MFFPDVLTKIPRGNADPVAWIAEQSKRIQEDPALSPEEKAARKISIFTDKYPKPVVMPGLETVFGHIDHAVNLVGEDHVGIGSDYDGIPYACAGIEDIGKLGNLVDLMRRRGYAQTAIDKIMGGNLLRVFREIAG